MSDYRQVSTQYTLGRGILMIKKVGQSSWIDLMHVKDVKVNVTADELEHENFRSGLKVVDKAITTKMTAKGSFMCDVPNPQNISLFLMGTDPIEVTQASGSWTAQAFTVVKPGEWQSLGKKDITVSSITDDAGTPVALVEGTDYLADWKRGMFLPLEGSTLIGAIGDGFKITGTYAESSITRIAAAVAPIQVHVWFMGDPATGKQADIRGFANIKPNGDLPLVSDEWSGFSFDISFNKHSDYPQSPVGMYYEDLGEVA